MLFHDYLLFLRKGSIYEEVLSTSATRDDSAHHPGIDGDCSLIKPDQPKSKPKPKPTSSQQTSKPDFSDVSKIISQGVQQLEAGQVKKAIASFEKAQKNDPKMQRPPNT
jgi:hypothetical protein